MTTWRVVTRTGQSVYATPREHQAEQFLAVRDAGAPEDAPHYLERTDDGGRTWNLVR